MPREMEKAIKRRDRQRGKEQRNRKQKILRHGGRIYVKRNGAEAGSNAEETEESQLVGN